MFLAWQRTVGQRTPNNQYSFTASVVWNNLPLPPVSQTMRATISDAAQEILVARENHPDRSLEDHYNPLSMDPVLLKAHRKLDRLVDRAFGAKKPLVSLEERQEVLFRQYEKMSSPLVKVKG